TGSDTTDLGQTDLLDSVCSTLKKAGQDHLIEILHGLSEVSRDKLLERLYQIQWNERFNPGPTPALTKVVASRVISLDERRIRAKELLSLGELAYKSGEVSALMVAAGQGTRLGLDAPKGCYQLGTVTGRTI